MLTCIVNHSNPALIATQEDDEVVLLRGCFLISCLVNRFMTDAPYTKTQPKQRFRPKAPLD